MIISHKLKYVFIHIPKTGGSSIEWLLINNPVFEVDVFGKNPFSTEQDYIDRPKMSKDLYAHSTAQVVKKYFKENGHDWSDYFKFAFIRNPWDFLVSSWEYHMAVQSKRPPETVPSHCLRIISKYKNNRSLFFLEHPVNMMSYIKDDDNKIIIDYIGKLETIENDMNHIIRKIIPNSYKYWEIPKKNATVRSHYHNYYDQETAEAVKMRAQEIVSIGNYTYEN